MNDKLQTILNLVQESSLSDEEKRKIIKAAAEADKQLSIVEFKLDRTEKVKKTTTILLEQTIEELEQKRKSVEEQNRELEIETALERVRTAAMAMKQPADMLEICKIIARELQSLDIQEIRNVQTAIFYYEKGTYMNYEYYVRHDKLLTTEVVFTDHPQQYEFAHKMMQGPDEFFTVSFRGQELRDWYEYQKNSPQFLDPLLETASSLNYYFYSMGPVALGMSTYEPMAADQIVLFKRFRNVFELAYRRYLDIEKAEAQAREAQIQLALERVRARTMAMHRSEELDETAQILFQQFKELGETPQQITIGIFNEQDRVIEFRVTDATGAALHESFRAGLDEPTLISKVHRAWRENKKSISIELTGEELLQWVKYRTELSGGKIDTNYKPEERRIVHVAFFSKGLVTFSANESRPESIGLLERFAAVFDLTYTRFLDLKNAEAQARESQIETSLERVRTMAMAMRKPEDLLRISEILFAELHKLGFSELRNTMINIHDDEKGSFLNYDFSHVSGATVNTISYNSHPVIENLVSEIGKANDAFAELVIRNKELDEWRDYRKRIGEKDDPLLDRVEALSYYFYSIGTGSIGISTYSSITEEKRNVLKRFRNVFDFSYRRYMDVAQAEAQARETQIEAALERVRSRTLAMHKSDELAETAAVVFRQLINLGIEPNRLYIAIIEEEPGIAEFWITDEDGSKVSSAFKTRMNANRSFQKMYDGWKEQRKSITIDMKGKELEEYFRHLTELNVPFKGGLSQKRRVQSIAYFSKGFIGIASPDQLPPETTQLLERFAAVFNLTFTRFNDLKIAEAHALQAEEDLVKLQTEKKRAEDALAELKSAQAQLIQSEKMASLGELTAGIAHEIQNPLNFVNNFSEVSSELLDEMKQELETGNGQSAMEIAGDVKQNLEKILHHGKRADAIVKGMLQHSRSSSGQKEPTDINALADEYLRLAYHGLRAKDKTFNAKFESRCDESVGKINIIPQDIGRVILNLINNAFYAVTEKKIQSHNGYEPTVIVSTKKLDDKIELRVSDNGDGIPQKVLDKIFQPFFTTKPTGQGTGLGLSLSYDIITKGHGGELKVNTVEGKGTEFIISLPAG